MDAGFRWISLLQRKWRSSKDCRRVLTRFNEARDEIGARLPSPRPAPDQLLIIRLDDIGDYVLFRNHLRMYKRSPRFPCHRVTLLGNDAWRSLFDQCDGDAVDDTLWVNKKTYLESAEYRLGIWQRLRAAGFSTVVAPSRARPLLLDDACMLAAAPLHAIAAANTDAHAEWNRVSDAIYDEILPPAAASLHEFLFNAEFTARCCGARYPGSRPRIDATLHDPPRRPYMLCFLGASTRSKRWPAQRWVDLIKLHAQRHPDEVILAGNSSDEVKMAEFIQSRSGAQSIAGATSLPELLRWIAGARILVTNDTMAAHLGVSCNRPTVIVANGVWYQRFTENARAGIGNAVTVYPLVFERKRQRLGEMRYRYVDAVTADIASIEAPRVFAAMEALTREADTAAPNPDISGDCASLRTDASP
jgi:ADP-heptose:LPS heptosyltransferase